jgi:hypothetical protein
MRKIGSSPHFINFSPGKDTSSKGNYMTSTSPDLQNQQNPARSDRYFF